MAFSTITLSSGRLLRQLKNTPVGLSVPFVKTGAGELVIGGFAFPFPGSAVNFTAFELPYEQVKSLVRVLAQVKEQPITLEYDNAWVTMKEVRI